MQFSQLTALTVLTLLTGSMAAPMAAPMPAAAPAPLAGPDENFDKLIMEKFAQLADKFKHPDKRSELDHNDRQGHKHEGDHGHHKAPHVHTAVGPRGYDGNPIEVMGRLDTGEKDIEKRGYYPGGAILPWNRLFRYFPGIMGV